MKLTSAMFFIFCCSAFSTESWLCTEDSSQIRGSTILACGVAESNTEGVARRLAFKNATEEFNSIKDSEYKYVTEPSRSTCSKNGEVWKCYRLIVYRMSNIKRNTASITIPSQSFYTIKSVEEIRSKTEIDNDKLIDRLINKTLRGLYE